MTTTAPQLSESSDIAFQVGPTTVYGTLVTPSGAGPFPAVVMAAGSGPTDRNWTSPLLPGTNGSAGLLADVLAQAGIASLRYDKLGTGPHVREDITAMMGKVSMERFSSEFAGAVNLLADRDDIRADRIFGLDNSEGTLHVLHYQLGNPKISLAGIILAAPPGRPVGAVARTQLAKQAAAAPNGDALLALYDEAIARWMAEQLVAPDPALPQGVQQLLQSLATPANLPFARELWAADAAPLLKQIQIPVLVIIGKKDIQVDWKIDGELLQAAAEGKKKVEFFFPENTNHILKYEPKPRTELVASDVTARYNAPDGTLDPEAIKEILKWLAEND
jgi:pimeloyl-ACP methyl ester carboxylesterase